jgi:hypothetical protein
MDLSKITTHPVKSCRWRQLIDNGGCASAKESDVPEFFSSKAKLEETRSSVFIYIYIFFQANVSAIHRKAENALFLPQQYRSGSQKRKR